MKRPYLIVVATCGSVALLAAAFGFQFIAGLPPCQMCLWQRWGHAIAAAMGVLALYWDTRAPVWLGGMAALSSGVTGFYHAGVEQSWWPGFTSCSGGDVHDLSVDELLDHILNAPLVRCDDIPWEMLGLSMAGWNAIFSLCLVVFWIQAARCPP
ncbi:MAG: disulfide bond formation protein B [Aestuariivita sp.]|nr:disulfide bond formation protein B [Aestuariivita sp.]